MRLSLLFLGSVVILALTVWTDSGVNGEAVAEPEALAEAKRTVKRKTTPKPGGSGPVRGSGPTQGPGTTTKPATTPKPGRISTTARRTGSKTKRSRRPGRKRKRTRAPGNSQKKEKKPSRVVQRIREIFRGMVQTLTEAGLALFGQAIESGTRAIINRSTNPSANYNDMDPLPLGNGEEVDMNPYLNKAGQGQGDEAMGEFLENMQSKIDRMKETNPEKQDALALLENSIQDIINETSPTPSSSNQEGGIDEPVPDDETDY